MPTATKSWPTSFVLKVHVATIAPPRINSFLLVGLSTITLLIIILASEGTAAACSCGERETLAAEIDGASVILLANAVANEKLWERSERPMRLARRVRLAPLRVWKGNARDQLEVFTASNTVACGYDFEQAGPHLIFASRDEKGELWVSACSRSKALGPNSDEMLWNEGQEEMDGLDSYRVASMATPASAPEQADIMVVEQTSLALESRSQGPSPWLCRIAIGVALLALALVVMLLRKRTTSK